jgi:FKBP-type peptidyl-prolyl cis-trans isomerase (trigger factor)
MTTALERKEDSSIILTMRIPWADVQKMYEMVVADFVAAAELPGFRKGKAPRDIVEKSLDKQKVFEEALKRILPNVYQEAVTTEKLKPIITPKIELVEAAEKKDWVIRAITCEQPEITLGDYKTAVHDVKNNKHKKIWLPGEKPDPEKEKETKPSLNEILEAVFQNVKIKIPAILIENDVNRALSELIDQTKKLGLTVEQYLASTGKTGDSIRHDYEHEAERTITLEFALEKIADTEGILISDDDINKAVETAKNDSERKMLEKERYYLATILRRQKTIDFLTSL